jgi:type IX secretion system PorP/SprF family membrane protein
MNRSCLWMSVVGALCLPLLMQAQQKPHYTQYILNQYIINPAITGIENYVDVKASHRRQWVGIQDAPLTTYFSIHGSLNKSSSKTSPTSFPTPGENPRGRSYWEEYEAPDPHHGIGMQVVQDVTGPLSNLTAQATYAYHLPLNTNTTLSAGMGVGINRIGIDPNKLNFGDVTVDPVVFTSGILNKIRLDMSAGLYLYSADYFVGVSAQQIVPQPIDFSDGYIRPQSGKTVPHVFATAGYRALIGENFNLIPSIMVKYVNPVPVQVEANFKLQYRSLAWLGASYRHLDGFAGMLGFNISNVQVGYAYDYTTSRLNNFSKGTHEFLIGFLIGNKYPDGCPRNVW